jgi:hypothetical protein
MFVCCYAAVVHTHYTTSGRLEERDDLNPFDDTRIHTECYIKHHWARQICANALDVDPEDYVQVVSVSVQQYAHLYDISSVLVKHVFVQIARVCACVYRQRGSKYTVC